MPTTNRLRNFLNAALPIGAVVATVAAVVLVVSLFWWARSLGTPASPPVVAHPRAPAAAPAVQANVAPVPPAPKVASAPRPAAPPVREAAAPPARPAVQAPPETGNSDVKKNQALGQALKHLGDDPDAQRRLGRTE